MAFKKGQSGNPNGRGKGSPNKRSITAAAIAKYNEENQGDALTEILGKMIDLAKEGDIQAAKLVMDRIEPAFKPQSKPIQLPRMPKDLFAKGEKILSLATTGEITVEIAKELLAGISVLLKTKEQHEFEARLKALENKNGNS